MYVYNYRAGGYSKHLSEGKGKSKLIEGSTIGVDIESIENELFKPARKKKRKNAKTKIKALLGVTPKVKEEEVDELINQEMES